jgi:hypothetical protein
MDNLNHVVGKRVREGNVCVGQTKQQKNTNTVSPGRNVPNRDSQATNNQNIATINNNASSQQIIQSAPTHIKKKQPVRRYPRQEGHVTTRKQTAAPKLIPRSTLNAARRSDISVRADLAPELTLFEDLQLLQAIQASEVDMKREELRILDQLKRIHRSYEKNSDNDLVRVFKMIPLQFLLAA